MTRTWYCDECGSVPGEQVEQLDEDSFFECKKCGSYVTLNITPWPTEWEKGFEAWLFGIMEYWKGHQYHGEAVARFIMHEVWRGLDILEEEIDTAEADDDTD